MGSGSELPADLNAAIATEPAWLQLWVLVLVVTNLASLAFVVGRREGAFHLRAEPIANLVSFVAAAVFMG